jgi:hypothetical protein
MIFIVSQWSIYAPTQASMPKCTHTMVLDMVAEHSVSQWFINVRKYLYMQTLAYYSCETIHRPYINLSARSVHTSARASPASCRSKTPEWRSESKPSKIAARLYNNADFSCVPARYFDVLGPRQIASYTDRTQLGVLRKQHEFAQLKI